MYLPAIHKSVRELLADFELKELANLPNAYGVYKQSEVALDIVEGQVNNDGITDEIIDLTLKVSIATIKLTTDKEDYDTADRDLETLISLIIKVVRKAVLPGTKRIRFESFQKFTPESGKHRCVLTFTIPAYITEFGGSIDDELRVKEVRLNYK